VRLQLNDIAHVFPAGHRIRISLSTNFWPLAWPAPRHAPITVHTEGSRLILPGLSSEEGLPEARQFGPAIVDDPGAVIVQASGGRTRKTVEDPAIGEVVVHVDRAKSTYRIPATGTEVSHQSGETFRIMRGSPNSARVEEWADWSLSRASWKVRTKSRVVLASTETTFDLSASMEAYHDDELLMSRHFAFNIPRRWC
jgi:hypothetical protein